MREILLLFAVPSGSRWPYRASASRRPWRLTRAIVFVGNIPDCAQHQKPKTTVLTLILKAHVSRRVKNEGRTRGMDAERGLLEHGCDNTA
ncbi:hypothetical protein OZ827_000397 [Yersinia enterocolitica]|nr:hypothetical protein [Yersinia enterocolitica]